MPARTLRLLAALFAALMVLGACGDDGGDETADGTTTTTTAGDDVEETTTTTDADATTTTTEAEDTTDTTTADGGEGTVLDEQTLAEIDDFCDFAALEEEGVMLFDVEGATTPEDVEESYQLMQAVFTRAAEVAPDELSSDLARLSSAMSDLFAVLEEYDFDFAALSQAAATDPELAERVEAFDDPALSEASDNIDAWVEENC